MRDNLPQPAWWRLYLIGALLVGGLALETRLPLSGWLHRAAQATWVLAAYGMVWRWLESTRRY